MTKLEDFMQTQKKEPKMGMEVECDVTCQVCHEYVDGAEYFHVEKLLRWTCSQGHVSFVEEFRI